MNKNEFLAELKSKLNCLPEKEAEKSLSYFSELIDDKIEDGISPEEAVSSLGSTSDIAKEIIGEMPFSTLVQGKIKSKGKIPVWAIVLLILGFPLWISIVAAVFSVIFAFYISIWSIVISLYAVIFSLGIGGIATLAMSYTGFFASAATGIFAIGSGLILTGLAVLLFIPIKELSIALIRFTGFVMKKIKLIFVKKEVE